MKLPIVLAAVTFLSCFAGGLPAAAAQQLITIPTRQGVTQSFYLTEPDRPPTASLILFPGGQGKLRNDNFLVRSRDLFVARGFTVAVIDTPSDEASGMDDSFRIGKANRADIAATIAWLRQHKAAPVWLVGTSMGTLSATNGATLEAGGADGLVLTSSVTRESKRAHNSVYDAGPNFVKLPTLLIHNREDGCVVCPFSDIPDLLERFKNAPRKQLIAFQGGDPPLSEPCKGLSRHGYLGIEDKVVAAIADWIIAQ